MNKKIVCIGDSLTEGWSIKLDSCWPSLLDNKLDICFVNSGICGDTTGGMLARFREMVINHKPDNVIIMGGTNDVGLNIPDNQIVGNILAMTRLARHYSIKSIIGIPPPYFLPDEYVDNQLFLDLLDMHKRLIGFGETLKRFINNDDQPSIDFSLNMTMNLYLPDGLHPNEKGHEMMAKNAMEQLDHFFSTK